MLTLFRVQKQLRDREVRSAESSATRRTPGSRLLSLRLQPHFLFNALNTISSTVYEDPVAADEMIGRLGDLLRQLAAARRPARDHRSAKSSTRCARISRSSRRGSATGVRCRRRGRSGARRSRRAGVHAPAARRERGASRRRHAEYRQLQTFDSHRATRRRNSRSSSRTTSTTPAEPDRVGTGLGTTRDRLRLLYGPTAELQTTSRATVAFASRFAFPPASSPRCTRHREPGACAR